jgi:threonylcarbamoyladenosine tRNA methylthiotransferase MtaB
MNIYLDSVGCRLNQSEVERIARQFVQAGHHLAANAEDADVVVINTCSVTAKAASDSRGKIRQAVRKNPNVKIISTGCWATLEADRAAVMENVVQVVLNAEKEELVQHFLALPEDYFQHKPIDYRVAMPGSHVHERAFIKVQDGCDNHCTFCVTRIARGKSISLPARAITADIQSAYESGAQEVVLSGVNLGAWGRDLTEQQQLSDLLRAILAETDIPRVRLSSLEPWDIDERFFELWQNPRMCRHFHLPLQSGSDVVLQRMGRRITRRQFSALVQAARAAIPALAITTDVIVGFPGEDEPAFQQTIDYVEEIGFSGGHVFSFSARPGTPAMKLSGQVDLDVKKERSKRLRLVFQRMGRQFRLAQIGKSFEVLWEDAREINPGQWRLSGLTDTYLRVYQTNTENNNHKIRTVRMKSVEYGIMIAENSQL